MQLLVQERIALLGLLPQQGDFATLKILRVLREELSFSSEEHELLEFVDTAENQIAWDGTKDPLKEFTFTRKETAIIEEALKKADKQKSLSFEHFSVFEKFFPEEEEPERLRPSE